MDFAESDGLVVFHHFVLILIIYKAYMIRKWSQVVLGNCMRIIFIFMLFLNDDKILRINPHSGIIMRILKKIISPKSINEYLFKV